MRILFAHVAKKQYLCTVKRKEQATFESKSKSHYCIPLRGCACAEILSPASRRGARAK